MIHPLACISYSNDPFYQTSHSNRPLDQVGTAATKNDKSTSPPLSYDLTTIFKEKCYKRVPRLEELAYRLEGSLKGPLFDAKWNTLALRYFDSKAILYTPKMYLDRAQILLDRFFTKNPSLLQDSHKALHPNIMLLTLHITFKITEDLLVWNIDQLGFLNDVADSELTLGDRQVFNRMELAYLSACNYELEIHSSPLAVLQAQLFKRAVSDQDLFTLLQPKLPGDFLIYSEADFYVLAVKIVQPTDKETIVCHPFFMNKEGHIDRVAHDQKTLLKPYKIDERGNRNSTFEPRELRYLDFHNFLSSCSAFGDAALCDEYVKH